MGGVLVHQNLLLWPSSFRSPCLPQVMPFPTSEKISENEFEIALNTLHKTLSQLPKQILFKDTQNNAFKQFCEPYFNKNEDEVATIE